MRYKISILVFFVLSLTGCAQSSIYEAIKTYNSGSVEYILVEDLKEKLESKEKVYLLDARAKEEYKVSHFKDAIWIGYKKFEKSKVENLDKDQLVVVYCSIGVRSEQIGEKLQDLGFKNVQNLYGGIFDWSNKGYPVYKNEMETNKVHAYNKFWSKFLTKAEKIY